MRSAGWCCAAFCLALFATPSASQDRAVLVEDYRFGNFIAASHLELDPFGSIYVTDAETHTISKFAADGGLLGITGGKGWELNSFDHPAGIDARLGMVVYVADRENHRVVRLDRDLHALGSFTTKGVPSTTTAFGLPLDVVTTSMGELLLLDGENQRVASTTGFAKVERSFGGVESGEGRLREPVAMARLDNDRLAVLERGRICFFDPFGNYLFAGAYKTFEDAKGIACHKDRVAVVTASELHVFKADGTPEHSFTRNRFVFAGETAAFQDVALTDGRIYILTANSVLVFTFTH